MQNQPHYLNDVNPARVIPVIEQGINLEKLNLEAHSLLGDEMECMDIRHRIADARALLLALRGKLLK
jgi:hypothetical protein